MRMLRKILVLIFGLFCGGVMGSRVRRHLVFSEGSRAFFSIDLRDNLFDYSSFFGHVFGLKMDWNLPTKTDNGAVKGKIQRRDLYQGMGHFLRWQNYNDTSCFRKFVCEASVFLPKSNHFLAQLYEVIFSAGDVDIRDAYKIDNSEQHCTDVLNPRMESDCPLSLMSIFSRTRSNFNILVK